MTDPLPLGFSRYHFLFETNSVRDFARDFTAEEWSATLNEWNKRKLTTGWLPGAIGEVMGTNLVRERSHLTKKDCRHIALAVSRFDMLANCGSLPGVLSLLKWSYHHFAGDSIPFPPPEDWKNVIERVKLLRDPSEIIWDRTESGLSVRFKDESGDEIGQVIPEGFSEEAGGRIANWKALLKRKSLLRDDFRTHEDTKLAILNEIMVHIAHQLARLGREILKLEDRIMKAVIGKSLTDFISTPLLHGMAIQDWYYILRAQGAKTGRIHESLGRDLLFAYYVPIAERFVTSDGEFRGIFREVIPPDRLLTFKEFKASILKT